MKGIPIHRVEYKRFLDEREAATYAGMNKREFLRECTVTPVLRGSGKKVWDVEKLDRWLDGAAQGHRIELEQALGNLV